MGPWEQAASNALSPANRLAAQQVSRRANIHLIGATDSVVDKGIMHWVLLSVLGSLLSISGLFSVWLLRITYVG